ncbi:carbohydrate ABC transporter permease [Aestuariivirga sp. YIM B02566]|uniref:Carbohydrate ABC transporter permease n=1 Tax=Taklimakanibacter albus TaxID=2800327 RepID=A0ACC5RDK7_9HYPH|nr:carbohydrate ABC transporter permease [Aestuariivirga sp. YIM B02566]MBK1870702.1 carbohydrate ABC transporter permease [Aestuariivirga sp. YIM B02566]
MGLFTRSRPIRSLLCWLLLAPLIALNLFPFAVMLSTALRPRDEIFINPQRWLPSRLAVENFSDMWTSVDYGTAVLNSLYVAVASVALVLLVGIPSAYALSRYDFRWKRKYQLFLLITQMVSPIVLALGLFRLFVWLGWIDSLDPVAIVVAAFNLAFSVMMLFNYFSTIPRDIEEAAWIDGASATASLIRIFLPLALPALSVTAMFTFVEVWNEFVITLTLVRSSEHFTLPLEVHALASNLYELKWHHIMAAVLVATLPVTALFMWLQRYLVGGMAAGAVK